MPNPHAPIRTADGRLFDVQELRVTPAFEWEHGYLVEMEVQDRESQLALPFSVLIRWEEWEERGSVTNSATASAAKGEPSPDHLCTLARRRVGHYLFENRFAPRFSAHNRKVHLEFP